MGAQDPVKRAPPTPDELRAWAELCEELAERARMFERPRLVREGDSGITSHIAAWEGLAAFLRDLL